MAILTYQDWKKAGKPYKEGVDLFKSLSNNHALIQLYEMDDDDYNRKSLDEKLIQLLPVDFKEADVVVWPGSGDGKEFKMISKPNVSKWNYDAFPEDLKKMAIRAGELTKKIDFNRGQLEHLQTEMERFEVAKIIMTSVKERVALHAELDHFTDTGERLNPIAPEPSTQPSIDSDERFKMLQRYKNLPPNISKAKRKNQIEKMNNLIQERDELKNKLGL